MQNNGTFGLFIIFIALVILAVSINFMCGVGSMGPQNKVEATVISKHVDVTSGEHGSSHYMITTDKGTFEVSNGPLLNVWNADEIFGRLHKDSTYTFVTRGKKVVNMFMQEYPYVVNVY